MDLGAKLFYKCQFDVELAESSPNRDLLWEILLRLRDWLRYKHYTLLDENIALTKAKVGTFLKDVEASQETEKSLTVLVEGKEVRKWLLSEKDGPGRQFFDESRWEHTVDYDGNMPDTFKWVFDILPEDIGVPVENGSEKF